MQQILILIGLTKISLKTFQLLLTATHLVTGIKQVNSSILTRLVILKTIQLVKYLLKKGLNTLNKLKNVEIIKQKKRTPKQKELFNLFSNLLDTVLTDKALILSKDKNENENDKTLMSSEDDIENENDKTLISSNEDNENENKTINQNNSDKIK